MDKIVKKKANSIQLDLFEIGEIWKDIVGYEGLYLISNFGNVKKAGFLKGRKTSILTTHKNTQGYMMVNLTKSKKAKLKSVHRLMGLAFISNPNNKPSINHIDGNKTNNVLTNLEWVTAQENTIHAHKIGIKINLKGEESGMSKLTERDVRYIRANKHLGGSKMGKMFGVHRSSIENVINNRTWKHVDEAKVIPIDTNCKIVRSAFIGVSKSDLDKLEDWVNMKTNNYK